MAEVANVNNSVNKLPEGAYLPKQNEVVEQMIDRVVKQISNPNRELVNKTEVQVPGPMEQYKATFEEISRRLRFDRNTLMNNHLNMEFGVLQRPNQMYVRLGDYRTEAFLKMLPPDFLLESRAMLQAMIGDPAFQQVMEGIFVNTTR